MTAHSTSDPVLHEETEVRRPGITALARSIAAEHPDWPATTVLAEAKREYERRRRQAEGGAQI